MVLPTRTLFVSLVLALVSIAAAVDDFDFEAARKRLHEAGERDDRPAVRAAAAETRQAARAVPNEPTVARRLNESAAFIRKNLSFMPVVHELAVEAVDLAQDGGYLDQNLDLFYWAADSAKLLRRYEDQLRLAQDWLDRADATGNQLQFVRAAFLVVDAHWTLDQLDQGLAVAERAISLAQTLDQHRMAGFLLLRTAATYRRVGDRPKQMRALTEALAEARKSKDVGIVAETAGQLGYERELDSQPDAADLIDEAARAARTVGRSMSGATGLAHVAAYHLHRSELDLAETTAREAVGSAAVAGFKGMHFTASTTLALALSRKGDIPGAIAAAEASMERLPADLLDDPTRLSFEERSGLVSLTGALADLHESGRDFEKALHFQRLAARVQALDTESRHKLLIAQANYRLEAAQRDQKIHDLERGRHLQQLELETERLALMNERNRGKALEKIEDARNLELASTRRMNGAYAIIAILAVCLLGVNLYAVFAQRRSGALLRKQNEQLRLLNAEKDEFLAIAAHDLKSPLGGIQRACEIIADHQTGVDFARELAGDMSQSAARMFHLVTRLLDLRRIGHAAEPLTPCNVTELARSIHTETLPRAAAKGIVLELDAPAEPVRALGDPVRISQILDNLLSNALKFSPQGRRVTVTVAQDATGPSLVVCDEGPGISREEQEKLFQKFTQLSARPTAGEHSSGLGLAIVHAHVAALGAAITCESEPGRGTRFVVRFQPVPHPQAVPVPAAA